MLSFDLRFITYKIWHLQLILFWIHIFSYLLYIAIHTSNKCHKLGISSLKNTIKTLTICDLDRTFAQIR